MSLHVGRNGNTTGCTTGTTTSNAPFLRPMPNRASTPPLPDRAHPTPVDHTSECSATDSPQCAPPPVAHLRPADAEDDTVRRWTSVATWASPGGATPASARHDHGGAEGPVPNPTWSPPSSRPRTAPATNAHHIEHRHPSFGGGRCSFGSTNKPAVRLCPIPLRPRRDEAYLRAPCGRGGIGRHARFRIWCRKAWGFESLRPHTAPLTRATTWKSHRKRSTT